MQPFRLPATPFATSLLLGAVLVLSSCGNDGIPNTPPGPGPVGRDPDFVAISVAGGAETAHTEASGLPAIACDPRVDWFLYQVVLYDNYTNGSGPLGYDFFFAIFFAGLVDRRRDLHGSR